MARTTRKWIGIGLALVLGTSCTGGRQGGEPSNISGAPIETDLRAEEGTIVIDASDVARPFDSRLLGTNIPAWVGPAKLADPLFQQRTRDLGTTVIRMPGGSWSDVYDWLACENGDSGCAWTWAAKPSDYLGFLAATGLQGMWTFDFNGTAQEAAALVAFFNGAVTDTRVIGVDRHGKDWGTVGQWAELRAKHGHADPQHVAYWEIGNEVYGARSSDAPGCASFGWEEVWTCDGTDYVNGDAEHDGYLAFRAAMKAVDPTIMVGAVGLGGYQSEWGGFGYEVIKGAGDALDFYVVHDYGFSSRPSLEALLGHPVRTWPDEMDEVRGALDDQNPQRSVPVYVTEYNLFAFIDGDTSGLMSKAANSLYIADTIGQMAANGVSAANQWNLINGATDAGSDYGMLDPDTSAPKPQFYAMALWSRFGDEMLRSAQGFDASTTLSTYAGRAADGTVSLIAINKTDSAVSATIELRHTSTAFDGTADVASAPSLEATSMSYNGSTSTSTALAQRPGTRFEVQPATPFEQSFAPRSITRLTLKPRAAAPPVSTS